MAINKPQDYDTAKAWGEYSPLEPGGYICLIKGAREKVSKAGNEMIEFIVDIYDGDEAGRFQREFDANTKEDKKWSNNATVRQLTLTKEGATNGGFKSMVEAIEESNGVSVEWGENFTRWMKGKLIGLVFGREQYKANDGSLRWSTKVGRGYKTIQQIKNGEFTIPADIPYSGNDGGSLADYMASSNTNGNGFTALQDDDIPF